MCECVARRVQCVEIIDGLRVSLLEPSKDQSPEARALGAVKGPAEVSAAASAEADLPGVAGEPAVLGDVGAAPGHARRGLEAADVEDDAGGVDAGVRVSTEDVDACVGGGDRVSVPAAHETLGRALLLVDGRPAGIAELGGLLANLELGTEHDHDCSVRRRTLLQLAAATWSVGCDGSRVAGWDHGATALALTESHAYWTSGVDHSGLLVAAREGGEPAVLYDGMPTAVALAAGSDAMFVASGRGIERAPYHGLRGALLIAEPDGVHRVVIDGEDLLWLVRRSGAIRRADLRGQGVTTLVEGPAWGSDLAVAADAIVWTSGEPGRLSRMARTGGEPETLVEGVHGMGPLAVVGAHVYFGHATGVSRVGLGGGAAEPIAEGRSCPSSLLPLGDGVCWSEEGRGGGKIVRWSAGGERAVDAGRVLAMATDGSGGETVWWIDGEGEALRRRRL